MKKPARDPLEDAALLRHMRDVCPKEGSGITSITLSTPGGKPVTVTAETRKRLNARLKALRRRKA